MFRNVAALLFIVIIMSLPASAIAAGRGVLASPHNLSAGGPSQTYAFDEIRVCVFCHTPHNAQPGSLAPLWNRELPPENQYTMYQSPYFNSKVTSTPSKPTGASRVCLSCHDGTLALNRYGGTVLGSSEAPKNLTGRANLTTKLSDDHPISFPFTTELSISANLVSPGLLTGAVKLDKRGYLQCTSCHDPHNNEYGNFLVMNNGDPTKPDYNPAVPSPLCVTCHNPPGWSISFHNTGDGCMNCHNSHTASVEQYLLKAPVDQVCFVGGCHSSGPAHVALDPVRTAAAGPGQFLISFITKSVFLANEPDRPRRFKERGTDLKTLFDRQIYRHPIGQNQGAHDRNEHLPMKRPHVECVDCHNGHLPGGMAASGILKRSLNGVTGISADSMASTVATREYEICYKCHSGSVSGNFIGIRKPNRVIQEPDQMKRFRPSNPSFHPVTVNRQGNGNSLLDEFRSSMIRIDCTDCHNSDESKKAGGTGPNGPHASRYEHILIARYEMPLAIGRRLTACIDYRTNYDLCFRCHSDSYVMVTGTAFANSGVNEHARHVVDRCIPCAACHDPHGVPLQGGATAANNAHLINFDRGYAAGHSIPLPRYQSLGTGRGSCTVNCHTGATHTYTR